MRRAIGEPVSGSHMRGSITFPGFAMSFPSHSSASESDVLMVRPGKWTLTVVTLLREERLRFNEIKRVAGISQKTLTLTLRELERDGFVSRTMYATIPPRVDYELTTLGRELLQLADSLRLFAARNAEQVLAARERFDAAGGEPVIRLVHPR
jgi:DNA-binding HxlR family transcriptional regulator